VGATDDHHPRAERQTPTARLFDVMDLVNLLIASEKKAA
jgi:hypothetical protein